MLVAVAVLVAGTACGGSGSSRLTERGNTMQDDQQYIAAVERLARQRGTGIVWVNPPDKRAKAAAKDRD